MYERIMKVDLPQTRCQLHDHAKQYDNDGACHNKRNGGKLHGDISHNGYEDLTSQIFNLECYTLDHHCISYFIAFCLDPRNSTQLKDPRRELGFCYFHI